MKASLRSVRIAPKKANLVAKMIRGKSVPDAIASLERTQKKSARLLEGLLRSAAANAKQNDNQNPDELVIKTLTVNKAVTYHRGIPMARGRMRRIRKFLSHMTVTLGYPERTEDQPSPTHYAKATRVKRLRSASREQRTEKKEIEGIEEKKEEKKAPAKKKTVTGSQKKKTPVKSPKKQSKTSAGSTSSLRAGSKKSKTTDTSKSS
jgi:large subunit ribosomal protein L22